MEQATPVDPRVTNMNLDALVPSLHTQDKPVLLSKDVH